MNGRIAVLLPTRNKPEELHRIIDELAWTTTKVDLFVYVALDDPQLDEYSRPLASSVQVEIVTGKRLWFCPAVNGLAQVAGKGYSLYMVASDDFSYRVPGWDVQYLAAIPPHGVAMIYNEANPVDGRALPYTAALTNKWVRTLGTVFPPGLKHMYGDDAHLALARGAGAIFWFGEHLVEHNWNPNDPRKAAYPPIGEDMMQYQWWVQNRLNAEVALLKGAMRNEP
jgi:hypothetical protein